MRTRALCASAWLAIAIALGTVPALANDARSTVTRARQSQRRIEALIAQLERRPSADLRYTGLVRAITALDVERIEVFGQMQRISPDPQTTAETRERMARALASLVARERELKQHLRAP